MKVNYRGYKIEAERQKSMASYKNWLSLYIWKKMKVNYRGYEIEAERQKSMAGYNLVCLSIARLSDNYFVEECPMYSSGETIHEIIKNAKKRIDLVEDCRVDNEIKGLEKKVR